MNLHWSVFLTILTKFCAVCDGVQQRFIEEPRSVSVKEGQNVTLSCSVDNKMGVLQWTKDDFGLGTFRNLSEYTRYQMVGQEGKEWNLLIVNATVDDDAKYQCQVGATETSKPIRSRYALVRVMSPPQPPVLTAGPELTLRHGKVALIQCISKGGKPASVIKWRRNGEMINEGVLEKVEKLNESARFMTVSTLTFPITANMTGNILECEASHEAQEISRTVSTKLNVEYAPVVDLSTDKENIYEGDSVKLSCSASAFPDLIEYRWSLDGEEIKEGRGAKEVVIVVDRGFNKKRVSCFARNTIGENLASLELHVKYSPIFKITPEDVTGNLGDKVSLECKVDSNPVAAYEWKFNGQFLSEGPLINFELSNKTSGKYSCEATVADFPSVSHSARVRLRGPPRILMEQGTQFSSVGETVHVICEAESVPAAKTFSWTFNGTPLSRGGAADPVTHSIIETQHGTLVRSTVIISEAEVHHFGQYRCTVSNEIGTSESTIMLVEKESMPLLIIIAASIGGFLFAIVILVVAVTWRKVSKAKSDSAKNSWPKTAHQIQPDRLSNSSNDSNIQSSNTTSSLSTVEDLEGCSDIAHEYQGAQYSRSPGLGSDNSVRNNRNYSNHNNYSDYRQFRSEHDLLDHAAKYSSDYHNPYLQTITPTSDYNSSGQDLENDEAFN